MNKKVILLNVIILGLLAGFVVISITFYYLVPVIGSGIDILTKAIEELLRTIWR